MLLWVFQYLHCKHLFMEGLGQRKLIYLGGVLRGMTQIRHIFRKVAVMHTKIMLYFVKVTGDVFWAFCFHPLIIFSRWFLALIKFFLRSLNVWGKHFNRSNNVPKPFIKTSIFEIFYENINLYLLLSPTYHIFKVVSSIDQIFFSKLKCTRKKF